MDIEKVHGMVYKLVDTFPETRKHCVTKMLNDLGEQYFTSPASTNEKYYGCCPGGLVENSMNVVKNLHSIQKSFCPNKFANHQLSFIGLFYDLGKIGNGTQQRYLENPNKYQRDSGKKFIINPDMPWIEPTDATLFILQKYSIDLTLDEYMAIKLSYGQYSDSNKPYQYKEPMLALLLHWAVRISSQQI